MENIKTKQPLNSSGGIYSIVNTITKKIYIGSTHNFKERFSCHNKRARQLYHNEELYKDIRKYGASNFLFTILEVENDVDKRIEKENKKIASLKKTGILYNKIFNSKKPQFATEETKKKMSASHKKERKYNPKTKQFEPKENNK